MQHQNSDKQFGGFMFIDFFLLHILSYSCAKPICLTGSIALLASDNLALLLYPY
jgi:hypothetical protein